MTLHGWLQIGLFSVLILAITKPLGAYMYRVFEGSTQPLPRFFGPIERFLYWLSGVDPKREQSWRRYALALLAFSLFGVIVTYGILRLQDRLPLNPEGLPAVPEQLAFNTAISFNTNTLTPVRTDFTASSNCGTSPRRRSPGPSRSIRKPMPTPGGAWMYCPACVRAWQRRCTRWRNCIPRCKFGQRQLPSAAVNQSA